MQDSSDFKFTELFLSRGWLVARYFECRDVGGNPGLLVNDPHFVSSNLQKPGFNQMCELPFVVRQERNDREFGSVRTFQVRVSIRPGTEAFTAKMYITIGWNPVTRKFDRGFCRRGTGASGKHEKKGDH